MLLSATWCLWPAHFMHNVHLYAFTSKLILTEIESL